MTDQTIPAGISPEEAKKAREWALHALNKPGASTTAEKAVARVVIGTVPEPRPTLADMTPEERRDCQWMQADAKGDEITAGIIAKINQTDAHLIASDGETWFLELDTVTPRPDLPRLEWPGDKEPKPAPAPSLPGGWRLADHPEYGRVIVTTENPDDDGFLAFVHRADDRHRQHAHGWCKPDALTYIDSPTAKEGDTSTAPDHLAVGTVIESADDPRIAALPDGSVLLDCDGENVAKRHGEWVGIGYIPIPSEGREFGPWTVLHIPKEDDQ